MTKRRSDLAADTRLAAVLDKVSDAFFALDRDWRVVLYNTAAEAFFGAPRERVLGRDFWEIYRLGRDTDYARALEAAMYERRSTHLTQPSAMRAGRTVEVRVEPLPDGAVGVSTLDITERTRAEDAAALSEQRLDLAVNAYAMGVYDWNFATGILDWNAEMATLLGLDPALRQGQLAMLRRMIPDEDRAHLDATMQAAAAAHAPTVSYQYRIHRPDGSLAWLEGAARFLYDAEGAPVRIVGTNIDVTERKTAEAHQRLLVNELNHRVKNTLATVQAIARQSLRGDGAHRAAMLDSFEGRLAALSAAHNVLNVRNWEGASIDQLVRVATQPYEDDGRRVSATGPAVELPPQAAVALALALHELATNAVKYGALSAPGGQVSVRWAQDPAPEGARLRLTWTETGGPPVTPPRQTGFGARLLQRGLAAELQGTVTLDFRPEGLACTIDAPLTRG